MVVDRKGRFVTAREDARLLGIHTAIEGESLVLDAPGAPTLKCPLVASSTRRRFVTVWKDECEALQDEAASAWIAELLGGPYAMVYMPDEVNRGVDPKHQGEGVVVSFADGFPFLLISEESLHELERRMERPVAMERFRPNIVVEGLTPHGEDDLKSFSIGEVAFRGAKLCSRCVLITIDPDTGEAGPEPLRTLGDYRTVDNRVMFGINLVHAGTGTITVGDELADR